MPGEVEEWRVVLDAPIYSVSNKGRVKNRRKEDRLLKITLVNGHPTVAIHSETRYIARLVYRAFVDDELGKTRVVHKDGNKENNKPANLMKKQKL